MRGRVAYVVMAVLTIWMSSALAQVGPGGGGSGGTSLPTTTSITASPDQAVSPPSLTGTGTFTFTNTGQTCSTSPCTITSATVVCNAATGAITLNLPAVSGSFRHILVKKVDATANACTLTPNLTDTIDNSANLALTGQFYTAQISDTGSGNWSVDDFYVANNNLISNYTGPVSVTGNRTNGADQISNVNVNGYFNPITFGADPTGVADSAPALQAAINAACAANGSAPGAPSGVSQVAEVYIPAGTYLWNEPVWSHCQALTNPTATKIVGAGEYSTSINVNFQGVALDVAPSNVVSAGGPVLVSSLASGAGNAVHIVSSFTDGFIDLDYILPLNITTSPFSGPFNGLSAFDFRSYFKIASITPGSPAQNTALWASEGAMNAAATCSGQGNCTNGVWVDMTTGVLHGGLTIGGTYYAVNSGATTVTGGQCYETELSYDGAHLNLYLGTNGTSSCASSPGTVTRVGQTAATGTVTQLADEANVLFADFNSYIYQGNNGGGPDREITMDSIQFSNVARNTGASYTQDTTKFSTDSNTLFLWNFDKTATFTGNSPFAQVDTPSNGWATWDHDGLGCCGGTQEISDFGLYQNQVAGAGILANAAILKAHDIWAQDFTDGVATGRNATYGSYLRQIDTFDDRRYGVAMLGGIGTLDTGSALGSFMPFTFNGVTARNLLVSANVNTYCGIGMQDNTILDNVIEDSENGGTFWGVCFTGGINNFASISHSALTGESKAPIGLMNGSGSTFVTALEVVDNRLDLIGGVDNVVDTNGLTNFSNSSIDLRDNLCNIANVDKSCTVSPRSILASAGPLIPYCVSDSSGSSCFSPSTTLPTCSSTNSHLKVTLTDAATPCINDQPIAGGGTGVCDAYCDGSSTWRYVGEQGQFTNVNLNNNGVFLPYATTFVDGHITFGNSTTCSASTGNITCNVPSGTANNDGLLMCIASFYQGNPWTAPAGWGSAVASSVSGSNNIITCFPRVSAGGEAGTPYTFNTNNPGTDFSRANGVMIDYKGTNTSTLVEASGTAAGHNTTSVVAPSITTSTAGDLLTTPLGICGQVVVPPVNQTIRINTPYVPTANNHLTALYLGDETVLLAGATGTRTTTIAPGTCDDGTIGYGRLDYGVANIALKPNASVGSTHIIDWSLGNTQFRTLADNVTYTFANVPSSSTQPQYLQVRTCEDSTGGRTVAFPGTVKWPGGTQPSMTTTANYCTTWQFETDNSNVYGSQVADAIH